MIEFRIANEEDGVMDYLVEWGEIERNNRTFYHLYVDGVKKDDTLYVSHLFDKAYCFGYGENKECGFGWVSPQKIQVNNGLVLIHKLVESHYSKSVMDVVNKGGKKHSSRCFNEVQVLVHSNGNILFEETEKHTTNKYYDILSDGLFSTHRSNRPTQYYRVEKDGVIQFFEGYEITKSKNCVYGHPCGEFGQNTSVVYCINKNSLKVTLDD